MRGRLILTGLAEVLETLYNNAKVLKKVSIRHGKLPWYAQPHTHFHLGISSGLQITPSEAGRAHPNITEGL